MSEPVSTVLGAEPRWMPLSSLPRRTLPRGLVRWLAVDASLTRRLRAACGGRFAVRVLRQSWGRPLMGESRLLRMRRAERALLRAVELCCEDTPWVFALTVIPSRSLRGPLRRLMRLGNRPLGAVLFSDPATRRGVTQVARLLPRHALFRAAAGTLSHWPAELWARRTVFSLSGRTLLVNEVFLPDVPLEHTEDSHGFLGR